MKERRNIKRKLARRRRKLERIKESEGKSVSTENLLKEIAELDTKLKDEDSAIKSLRAWRDAQLEKAWAQFKADLKSEIDKIIEEETRSRDAVLRKKEEISDLEEATEAVASKIDKLIQSKKRKLSSL